MGTTLSADWASGLSSIFRSPFLLPSVLLHALFFLLLVRAVNLQLSQPQPDAPISVQLTEVRDGLSPNKSIGPAEGPGGPKTMPKLGVPIPPAQRTGKLDSGSLETSVPSPTVEPAPAPPKAVALPGPKLLASADTRQESVNARETAPDSLVRLPTKEAPTSLPGSAAAENELNQRSLAAAKAGDGPGIRALKEGAQIPGALKGSGSGSGPYGVSGGSRSGTGIAGGGTGSGTGGGSNTGLKGISSAEFNQYLNQLKKRVESVWKYPDGVSGVQRVAIVFTLDRAGKLLQADVADSSDARMNTSAVEAMRRASPFPPIPENLKELANEPLRMQFTVTVGVRG
jgi:TonB family protein